MRSSLVAGVILALSVTTHAQVSNFTPMTLQRVRQIEQRIATVHAASGTEADFTETWQSPLPHTWRGHAVFSNIGFVLDYTVPAGRRVTSDLSSTRVREPSQQYKFVVSEGPASGSAYVGLNVLTGIAPSMTSGAEDVANGAGFLDDGYTSIFVSTASGRVESINHRSRPDIRFTNIRPMATAIAVARVRAALPP